MRNLFLLKSVLCAAVTVLLLALTSPPASAADTKLGPVVKERVIRAPRQAVWERLTTTDGVRSFLAPDAHIELAIGGKYEVYFLPTAPQGQRGSEGCRVLSYEPERMLSFSWNAPPTFENERWQRTVVVISLSDEPGLHTRVRLTHHDWREGGRWPEVHAYFDRVWDFVLANLDRSFVDGPVFGPVEAAPERPTPRHYVCFIRPVRDNFMATITDAERELMREHSAHIRRLRAEGRLIIAGPSTDPAQYPDATEACVAMEIPAPGIIIFEAADDEEAKRIMEADPVVRAGLFKAQVNPFRLSFSR